VQEAALAVPAGETLSLIGGDIGISGTEVDGTGVLTAPGGRFNLASVASSGEVILNAAGTAPDLEVNSFTTLGDIKKNRNVNTIVLHFGSMAMKRLLQVINSFSILSNRNCLSFYYITIFKFCKSFLKKFAIIFRLTLFVA